MKTSMPSFSGRLLQAVFGCVLGLSASQTLPAQTAVVVAANEKTAQRPLTYDIHPGWFNLHGTPLTQEPELLLRFTEPVEASEAQPKMAFQDGEGRRIPVVARTPNLGKTEPLQPAGDAAKKLPVERFLVVRPSVPLPLGTEWKLTLAQGLASRDGTASLAQNFESDLGDIDAFEVNSIEAVNPYNDAKRIHVWLNKPLSPSMKPDLLASFVSIEPQPLNFKRLVEGQSITLEGDFEYSKPYQVTVLPGITAIDSTSLTEEKKESVVFEPAGAFITLPAFSTGQNAGGHGVFKVQTGNLKKLHLRVKHLEGRDLIYALRGFDAYDGSGAEKRKVPFEMVPGKTIYDEEREIDEPLDTTKSVELVWKDLLGGRDTGAVYLCAEGDSKIAKQTGAGAQSLVMITDLGLAWKQSKDESLIHVFSLTKGTPVAKARVALLDDDGQVVFDLLTNEDGVVHLPSEKVTDKTRWLSASTGDGDAYVVEYDNYMESIGLWNFGIRYEYRYEDGDSEEEGRQRVLLFSDRGVYKPGETLYLKGISRLTDGDKLIPVNSQGTRATLKVFDPRRRIVSDQTVSLSAQGTFDEAIKLPEATLGWYAVELDFNAPGTKQRDWRKVFRHSFQVAEYRVNTFEVDLDANKTYPVDEEIEIPVHANYYMGKSLSKAKLDWHVDAFTDYPQPRGFENFLFGDNVENPNDNFNTSQSVTLGADGSSLIRFGLPKQQTFPSPRRVSLSASVTDINQQTVAQSASFTVDSSAFYLGLAVPESLTRAGETVGISLAAVQAEGGMLERPVSCLLRVQREVWNTVKVQGAGGRITNRNEKTLQLVSETPVTISMTVEPATGLPRPTRHELSFAEAGDYVISIESKDDADRPVLSRCQFRVIGAEEPSWSWHDGIRIDLLPDKANYRAGETAKLLLRSPIFGHALITLERAGVRKVLSREITAYETVIEIPITSDDAPNVYASAMVLRGSLSSPHVHKSTDFRLGYCQLLVENPAARATVSLEMPKGPVRPGQKATVGAVILDESKQPIPGVEVALYGVDEGVLSLTGYETPDPVATFHSPFPLSVSTGESISKLLPENPAEQFFDNKGYVLGGGGEEGGMNPNRVRKNFQALAFWHGSLITGPDGRVAAEFTAPDNLTSFRVMAVAILGNRFGAAAERFQVNKPLMLEPSLPAFGNVGDQIDLTAVLHNTTKEALTIEVSTQLDDKAEFLPEVRLLVPTKLQTLPSMPDTPVQKTREVTLQAGETAALRFPAQFTRRGEATWTWKAACRAKPDYGDAVESKLSIGYPVPLLRSRETLRLEAGQPSRNLLAGVNPQLLQGEGKVSVTVTNSRIGETVDALEYLLHYPYGCVEQTTSSTLPWLSTQILQDSLPALKRSPEEIRSSIQYGTRRLLTMQTNKGGLAYWPGGNEPMLWGSAYGGMALALAARQGVELPKDQLEALWKYLSSQLRGTNEEGQVDALAERCLALYTLALAGKPEPGYYEVMLRKKDKLPRSARALLSLAMLETGENETSKAAITEKVKELLAPRANSAQSARAWYGESYHLATELLAWTKLDPANPTTDATLDNLLRTKRGDHGWGSTYSNAWPLLAVARNAQALPLTGSQKATLVFADQKWTDEFGLKPTGFTHESPFIGDFRNTPLTFDSPTKGRLYANVLVETQPAGLSLDAQSHEGFSITRTYQRLENDGTLSPAENLTVGDLVQITLQVIIPNQTDYVAIDDPLPAIFEAINPDFRTQAAQSPQGVAQNTWHPLYCNFRELRKDRALFFADSVYRPGQYALRYLARVVAAGTATAPAAKVEAMYEPQHFGLSGTTRIVAKPFDAGADRVAQVR